MKVKVRRGYTLFYKAQAIVGEDQIIEVDPQAIKGQEWKVEIVREPRKEKTMKQPPKDKMVRRSKTK